MKNHPPLPPVYRQESILGRGSFGTVYLARHIESGELLALKEFETDKSSADNLRWEMSHLFSVNHPNVVRCVGVEYGHQGHHFLVLEYVNHGSLRDRLRRRGKYSLKGALKILDQVVAGVVCLHDHGIVHRDLKPENILLHRDEGRVTFKISDFGIARQVRDTTSHPTTSGSPSYMAPEQFVTESVRASDLYSIGVIFYELLAGRRPFAGGPKELFMHHFRSEPDLSPIENEQARELIGKLLSKDPGERGRSAAELRTALQTLEAALRPDKSENEEVPTWARTADLAQSPTQSPVPEPYQETEAWNLVFRHEWRLAGAHTLAAPAPDDIHFFVGDGEFTARLNARTGRQQQQYLKEDLVCSSMVTPGSASGYLATNRYVYRCRKEQGDLEALFDPPPGVQSLAVTPDGRHLFVATANSFCCFSEEGRQTWFREIVNYLLPAQLLVWREENVFITSGPHSPRIHLYNLEGEVIQEFELQRPPLALLQAAPDLSEMLVIESGFADALPARLRKLDSQGNWLPPHDLANGIFKVRWHCNCLSLFEVTGKVFVINTFGKRILEHQEDGEILDACFQPGAGFYTLLVKSHNRTTIRTYQLERSVV